MKRPPQDQKQPFAPQSKPSQLRDNQKLLQTEPFRTYFVDLEDSKYIVVISQQSKHSAACVQVFDSSKLKLIKQFNLLNQLLFFFDSLLDGEKLYLATNRGVFFLNLKKLEDVVKIYDSQLVCKCLFPLGQNKIGFVEHDLDFNFQIKTNCIIVMEDLMLSNKVQLDQRIISVKRFKDSFYVLSQEVAEFPFDELPRY